MYPKSRIFNELSSSEISVWTKLNPGISPSQWAELCRFIGNLSPKEFTAVVALINAHKCLKNAVKRHVEGIVGIGEPPLFDQESLYPHPQFPLSIFE